MIYECRVNLKNKRKDELIMYLEEALQTIQKQDTEINKLNSVIDKMAEQLAGLAIWDNNKKEPLILTDVAEVKEYFLKEDK